MKRPLQAAWAMAALILAAHAAPARSETVPVPSGMEDAIESARLSVQPTTAARGQTITWRLSLDLREGQHAYPTKQNSTDDLIQNYVTKFHWPPEVVPVGEFSESDPVLREEKGIGQYLVLEGKVFWERHLVVSPKATPGTKQLAVHVTGSICTDQHCKQLDLRVPLVLTIANAPAVAVDPRFAKEVTPTQDPAAPKAGGPKSGAPVSDGDPFDTTPSSPGSTKSGSSTPSGTVKAATATASTIPVSAHQEELQGVLSRLETQHVETPTGLSFILAGIFWGAISLVTPCVFPMIPITVSFFLKQSEKEHHRPITMACVYCLTIVIVLTAAAISLLSFFRWLSVNPLMNFGLGILFVVFALSLFGLFDLELPSGLARLTSSREGRGGLLGTMFMALTFTIVSFACVAPFLGGFGGTAAGSNLRWTDRVLGGLAFSITFASPFFLLALFPGLLKKVPRSGSWLNSVKVVMGFLELAAALNFLRAGELVLNHGSSSFFTYDLVLGLCVALAFLCGLYLLGFYRLPYDTPNEHVGVVRLMLSFLFLGLGLYLLPGLFKSGPDGDRQRPSGAVYAWFESFLLPESRQTKGELTWTADLPKALAEAAADSGKPKLVFVDFTGVTCKNCALNELNVFSKPEIQELFKPYARVQLFTDTIPDRYYSGTDRRRANADAAANLWFQRQAFGTEQLPLYVILKPEPDGKIGVAGVYAEGKINDEKTFVEFLKRPIKELAGARLQAASTN
jgi:thiol:disulfide interchange protein DsbD